MTIKQRIRRIFPLVLEPREVAWVIRRRMPNIIHETRRALVSRVIIDGRPCVKKVFHHGDVGVECYNKELLARELFKSRPWVAPIIKKGRRWFAMPCYPVEMRLDRAALQMDESMRFNVATRLVQIMFEIFSEGYAHCDFHAGNMFWVVKEVIVTDFETIQRYPEGQRPSFPLCYDITGKGLDSPFTTRNMCYTAKNDPSKKALERVLGIPAETVLRHFLGSVSTRTHAGR